MQAALRSGNPQPWMYEAVALAMQAAGSPKAEVERALMSAIDFGESTRRTTVRRSVHGPHGLGEAGPADLSTRFRIAEPLRPEPYLYGLQLAQQLNDPEGIHWSSLGILKQAWPTEQGAGRRTSQAGRRRRVAELRARTKPQPRRPLPSGTRQGHGARLHRQGHLDRRCRRRRDGRRAVRRRLLVPQPAHQRWRRAAGR